MSLTLEKVRPSSTQKLINGTKLFSYETTNEFSKCEEYTISNTDQYGYHVISDNGNTIIFGTVNALRSIFMVLD